MKEGLFYLVLLGVFVSSLSLASGVVVPATDCMPDVELINQDPYPANPGDYVKVVFEIEGLSNSDCQTVSFEIRESFPFSLDPDQTRRYRFSGDAYVKDFSTTALAPYELRVDKDAIDGDNEIEGLLTYIDADGNQISRIEEFDINVDGVKVDFEVSIRDYVPSTNTLTFEILNIGEDDVVGLAVDVPKQEAITIKGAKRNIIGDLDASDDTSFRFEGQPTDGEIELYISYTDSLNERREMVKKVYYDSSYFTGRAADQVEPVSTYAYLFWGLVVILIIKWIWGRWRRKKNKKK